MRDDVKEFVIKNRDSLQIEWTSPKDLKPNPDNPRVHPTEAIDKLVRSIDKYGWTNPIIVTQDMMVLAGHARLKAAKKAGLEEVPYIKLAVSGDDIELYTIADNKLQEGTFWDEEALSKMVTELVDRNNDNLKELEAAGFNPVELDDLLSEFEDDMERLEDDFDVMDEDNMEVDYVCPKCGYEWSGKANPGE